GHGDFLCSRGPLFRRFSLLAGEAKHVEHGIIARFLTPRPEGGADGAAGEDRAVGGRVGEFDDFALAGDDDGMLADDGAAAQGGEADRTILARAGMTVANLDR